MANKEGKKFEEDFKNSVPDDVWKYRLRDSTASWGSDDTPKDGAEGIADNGDEKKGKTRFQIENICDFELYYYGLFLVETKSHKDKSLPHKEFLYQSGKKKGEIKHLYELVAAQAFGIVSVVIINMRDVEETYALHADDVLDHILHSGIKSIPIAYMRECGYRLKAEKKRTRWRYDIKDLIANIRN